MDSVWHDEIEWQYKIWHPVYTIRDFFRKIKWSWQRVFRGYCDKDTWNVDAWFLSVVPDIIDQLRENTHGYPGEFVIDGLTEEQAIQKWDDILGEISSCFTEASNYLGSYEEDGISDRANDRGFYLMRKYFWNLWD